MKMKLAVVGGGITGLAAGYYLAKKGYEVTVFEKSGVWGGLAASFVVNGGHPLERFYHHLFSTDEELIGLISELGLSEKLIFRASKTGVFYRGREHPFAAPLDILRFKPLGIVDRLRLGMVSLYLRTEFRWRSFERLTAGEWLERWYGKTVSEAVWFPLLRGKFGKRWREVSLVWFWARIKKRSFRLGYLEGGFQVLVETLRERIKEAGGDLRLDAGVSEIRPLKNGQLEVVAAGGGGVFNRVVVTVPVPVFLQLVRRLPQAYRERLGSIEFLWAQSLVLVLDRPLINSYWLNINEEGFPFLAVVEQTNLVSPGSYGGGRIVYLGNYLESDDKKLKMAKEDLFELFTPCIKRINPAFAKSWVREIFYFKSPFAQPIVDGGYRERSLTGFKTPVKNLYLATQAQIYPWDRGMNFAVKLARELADKNF